MNDLTIALVVAVIGPLILTWLTGRQRAHEKKQDWERQDAVAAEAARQQKEVADQAAEAARLLVKQNELVAETARQTHDKLEVIRVDVNSNMTAAMQAELDATIREHAMMKEVITLKEAAGSRPTEEARVAVKATEDRIAELRAKLRDRLTSTEHLEAKGPEKGRG